MKNAASYLQAVKPAKTLQSISVHLVITDLQGLRKGSCLGQQGQVFVLISCSHNAFIYSSKCSLMIHWRPIVSCATPWRQELRAGVWGHMQPLKNHIGASLSSLLIPKLINRKKLPTSAKSETFAHGLILQSQAMTSQPSPEPTLLNQEFVNSGSTLTNKT